jgi:hypothetical protein
MPIEDIASLLDDGDELIDFLANRGSEKSVEQPTWAAA